MGGRAAPALKPDILGSMDTVKGIFLVLHLLSWALVLGGWFATIRKPQVTPGMMHGSIGALLFGVILMGMAEMGDGSPNHLKLGIKALFAIIVVVLLALARRQQAAVSAIGTVETSGTADPASEGESALIATTTAGARVLINLAGVLVIVNVAIAVLWR